MDVELIPAAFPEINRSNALKNGKIQMNPNTIMQQRAQFFRLLNPNSTNAKKTKNPAPYIEIMPGNLIFPITAIIIKYVQPPPQAISKGMLNSSAANAAIGRVSEASHIAAIISLMD